MARRYRYCALRFFWIGAWLVLAKTRRATQFTFDASGTTTVTYRTQLHVYPSHIGLTSVANSRVSVTNSRVSVANDRLSVVIGRKYRFIGRASVTNDRYNYYLYDISVASKAFYFDHDR